MSPIPSSRPNVDYILLLVAQYRAERGDGRDTEMRDQITRAIDASPSLRNKKDLIEAFVDRVSITGDIDREWDAHVAERRAAELDRIIADENLQPAETREFIDRAFRDGGIQSTGIAITRVLPPASRFTGDTTHADTKQRVLTRLGDFFDRFFGLAPTPRDD